MTQPTSPARSQLKPGVTYVARVVASAHGDIPPFDTKSPKRQDFKVRVTWANGRGRVDPLEGNPDWKAGHYILFDSTGVVAVHGGDKTFADASEDFVRRLMPDMSVVVRPTSTKLETVQQSATPEGQAASHVRLRHTVLSYFDEDDPEVTNDDEYADMITENVIDYWLAPASAFPTGAVSPDIGPPPLAEGSALTLWTHRQKLVKDLLPPGRVALRIVINTTVRIPAAGQSISFTETTYLSEMKRAEVDLNQLVVPGGFSDATADGLPVDGEPKRDGKWAARWRSPPNGK